MSPKASSISSSIAATERSTSASVVDQFDTEIDPGEQSLSGYWRRSQASFHHGAGYKYEPDRTEGGFYGFDRYAEGLAGVAEVI